MFRPKATILSIGLGDCRLAVRRHRLHRTYSSSCGYSDVRCGVHGSAAGDMTMEVSLSTVDESVESVLEVEDVLLVRD
jgi:hypothetical protein